MAAFKDPEVMAALQDGTYFSPEYFLLSLTVGLCSDFTYGDMVKILKWSQQLARHICQHRL